MGHKASTVFYFDGDKIFSGWEFMPDSAREVALLSFGEQFLGVEIHVGVLKLGEVMETRLGRVGSPDSIGLVIEWDKALTVAQLIH